MTNMQSTEHAQKTQGKIDAATFLKSIEALKGVDWDRSVQDRIHAIEYSHDDDCRLTVRDLAEIKELDQALRNENNARIDDAEAAGARHDEWMEQLNLDLAGYWKSDMPK